MTERRSWSRIVLMVILAAFALVGFLSILGVSTYVGTLFGARGNARFTSAGATVEQVKSLKLLTVLTFRITTDMEGEYAERKGVWLAKGSADYVVDFAKAEVVAAHEASRRVTLRLPEPVVRGATIDLAATKLLTYEKTGIGWWTFGALGSKDEFEQKSREMLQRRIESAAAEAPLLEQARVAANNLITSLYAPVGWTVTIEWAPATPAR